MRSLSIAAVALLGSALSVASAEQTKSPRNGTQGKTTQAAHIASSQPTRNSQALWGRVNPYANTSKPTVLPQGGASHHSNVSGGSDNCGTATAISGPGPFTGDNIGATNDGPAACGVLQSDVWYDWTAGFSGPANFSLCGSTFDTTIAVYDTAACQGAQLACNDDFCAFQSQTQVNVVSGNVYKVQIGGFVGAQGSYTLSIAAPPSCPCTGAPPEGEPPPCGVPVDTFDGGCNSSPPVYSSIACGGSVCGNCAFNGSYRDTDWYQFTLTSTQDITWTVTGENPMVALLLDNNCPATVLAVGQATACQPAVAATTLTAGTYVAWAGPDFSTIITCGTHDSYLGALTCVTPPPPGPCDVYDDGSSENSIGWGASGTDILWMHVQGDTPMTTLVTSVNTAWGTASFPGFGPPNGSTARVGIWQDTDNDGDPTTGMVLLQETSCIVAGVDTDVLQTVTLSPPVTVSGHYFIGASADAPFPAPLDQHTSGGVHSWIAGDPGVSLGVNFNNLNAAPFPPTTEDSIGFPGVWLLEATCSSLGGATYYCFGTNTSCPCSNGGAAGNGCANSDHPGGANLSATGTASLAADTIQLTCVGHHNSTGVALFMQGLADVGPFVYGDGNRCIGSPFKRVFKISPANTPSLVAPSAASTPPSPATLSSQSAALGDVLAPGDVRGYQLLYRDPSATFCPPGTFNASNAVRVVWGP
jgi:hypothetical protein